MPRRHKLLAIAIAILVIVPVAVVVFVATFDWNHAKSWVERRASASAGRDIAIGGNLDASWHWRRRSGGEDVFSPGFGFSAKGVRIGNPDWAKRPEFAELEALEIDLRLLPLLWHHFDVPSIRLVHPSLDLERRKDGSNNWTFVPTGKSESSAWTFEAGEIAFDAGKVHVQDAERDLALDAEIKPLDGPIEFGQRVEGDDPSTRREVIQRVGRAAAEKLRKAADERAARREARGNEKKPMPYVFEWSAHGTMHGAAVKGKGRFGGVLALEESRPFPVRADIDVGATEIALTGTITDPTSPDAVDMRLWISGPNLADLYAITGIALPNSPPYATVGRLAGRFHPDRSLLRYEDFTARVGGSDLAGTLTYKSGDPRPSLTGEVDSTLLQFKDLGALVGAGPVSEKETSDRVLPVMPFHVERWRAMDADVRFTGKRVIRTQELPISDVAARIRMDAGVLTLDPLTFGMAGGEVASSLRIDSKADPPKGTVDLRARKLKLRRLFENVDGLSQSLGEVGGDVKLAGSGQSIAGLLGASDGSVKLLMTDGQVSETLMEEAGLNLANVLIAKLRGDEQVRINCGAAALTAKDGVATTDLFLFDTDNALVDITGSINLRDERVDLTLHPQTKGLRVFSLRSPLHVEGSFLHLDVSVDKKSLLTRGAGALGLGLIAAPLAALVPLIAPSRGEEKSCAPLVAELKQSSAKPLPAKKAASPKKSGSAK